MRGGEECWQQRERGREDMCTRKSQVYPTLLFSNPPPLALNSFPAPSCGDAQAAKEDKSDDRPVFLSISILEKKWASQMSLPGNGPR